MDCLCGAANPFSNLRSGWRIVGGPVARTRCGGSTCSDVGTDGACLDVLIGPGIVAIVEPGLPTIVLVIAALVVSITRGQ